MTDFRTYSAAFHAQNDDILHFGILGMKWGVRRYQNPDGTLTTAGKKRYTNTNNRAQLADKYVQDLKDEEANQKDIDYWQKRADKLHKKAEKYGTPEKDEYIKTRNSFKTDEEKDKFEREYDKKLLKDLKKSLSDDGFKESKGEYTKKRNGIDYILDKNSLSTSKNNYDKFLKDEKKAKKKIEKALTNHLMVEYQRKNSDYGYGVEVRAATDAALRMRNSKKGGFVFDDEGVKALYDLEGMTYEVLYDLNKKRAKSINEV